MPSYLIEPLSVTQSGRLTGKSVRTYELDDDNQLTGVVYSLKNGSLVKGTGTKKVSGWRPISRHPVHSSIPPMKDCWNYYRFTSPELALLAKFSSYSRQLANVQTQQRQIAANLASHASYTSQFDKLSSAYPECFL